MSDELCSFIISSSLEAQFPNVNWRYDRLLVIPQLYFPQNERTFCKAVKGNSTQICVSWIPSPEATVYLLEWCLNPDFKGPSLKETLVAAPLNYYCFNKQDIRQGDVVYWRVQAANIIQGGVSNKSETRKFTYSCGQEQSNVDPTRCDELNVEITLNGPSSINCCEKHLYDVQITWDCYDIVTDWLSNTTVPRLLVDDILWYADTKDDSIILHKGANPYQIYVEGKKAGSQTVELCFDIRFIDRLAMEDFLSNPLNAQLTGGSSSTTTSFDPLDTDNVFVCTKCVRITIDCVDKPEYITLDPDFKKEKDTILEPLGTAIKPVLNDIECKDCTGGCTLRPHQRVLMNGAVSWELLDIPGLQPLCYNPDLCNLQFEIEVTLHALYPNGKYEIYMPPAAVFESISPIDTPVYYTQDHVVITYFSDSGVEAEDITFTISYNGCSKSIIDSIKIRKVEEGNIGDYSYLGYYLECNKYLNFSGPVRRIDNGCENKNFDKWPSCRKQVKCNYGALEIEVQGYTFFLSPNDSVVKELGITYKGCCGSNSIFVIASMVEVFDITTPEGGISFDLDLTILCGNDRYEIANKRIQFSCEESSVICLDPIDGCDFEIKLRNVPFKLYDDLGPPCECFPKTPKVTVLVGDGTTDPVEYTSFSIYGIRYINGKWTIPTVNNSVIIGNQKLVLTDMYFDGCYLHVKFCLLSTSAGCVNCGPLVCACTGCDVRLAPITLTGTAKYINHITDEILDQREDVLLTLDCVSKPSDSKYKSNFLIFKDIEVENGVVCYYRGYIEIEETGTYLYIVGANNFKEKIKASTEIDCPINTLSASQNRLTFYFNVGSCSSFNVSASRELVVDLLPGQNCLDCGNFSSSFLDVQMNSYLCSTNVYSRIDPLTIDSKFVKIAVEDGEQCYDVNDILEATVNIPIDCSLKDSGNKLGVDLLRITGGGVGGLDVINVDGCDVLSLPNCGTLAGIPVFMNIPYNFRPLEIIQPNESGWVQFITGALNGKTAKLFNDTSTVFNKNVVYSLEYDSDCSPFFRGTAGNILNDFLSTLVVLSGSVFEPNCSGLCTWVANNELKWVKKKGCKTLDPEAKIKCCLFNGLVCEERTLADCTAAEGVEVEACNLCNSGTSSTTSDGTTTYDPLNCLPELSTLLCPETSTTEDGSSSTTDDGSSSTTTTKSCFGGCTLGCDPIAKRWVRTVSLSTGNLCGYESEECHCDEEGLALIGTPCEVGSLQQTFGCVRGPEECDCDEPDYCPVEIGECAITICTDTTIYENPDGCIAEPSSSTTTSDGTTTTGDGGTTTTGDGGTTTTSGDPPCGDCVFWKYGGVIHIINRCNSGCTCAETPDLVECQIICLPCPVYQPPPPPPPPGCGGICSWILLYNGTWSLISENCDGGGQCSPGVCVCPRPADILGPGPVDPCDIGGLYCPEYTTTNCRWVCPTAPDPDPTTPDPNPTTSTTTDGTTSTLDPENCPLHYCYWKLELKDLADPVQVGEDCPPSCDCPEPEISDFEWACEVVKKQCIQATTADPTTSTSTAGPTTTTTLGPDTEYCCYSNGNCLIVPINSCKGTVVETCESCSTTTTVDLGNLGACCCPPFNDCEEDVPEKLCNCEHYPGQTCAEVDCMGDTCTGVCVYTCEDGEYILVEAICLGVGCSCAATYTPPGPVTFCECGPDPSSCLLEVPCGVI